MTIDETIDQLLKFKSELGGDTELYKQQLDDHGNPTVFITWCVTLEEQSPQQNLERRVVLV